MGTLASGGERFPSRPTVFVIDYSISHHISIKGKSAILDVEINSVYQIKGGRGMILCLS